MKTNTLSTHVEIVSRESPEKGVYQTLADADKRPDVARARVFVEPFIGGVQMITGEDTLAHADAVVQILKDLQASESLQVAAYLVYAVEHIQHPKEVIEKAFGTSIGNLVIDTQRLIQVQRSSRQNHLAKNQKNFVANQTELARKMLLAFSRDLRGVMLRLSSRLQTMRYSSENRLELPQGMAEETLYVFAPLASRLGIWQIKWELEDLSFRYLQPDLYRSIASQLDEKRVDRENYIQQTCQKLENSIHQQLNIEKAQISGRPKHIYSIWKKMQGKSLAFSELYDLYAFRILVPDVEDCYTVLNWINEHFEQIPSEFDDYIAKPKLNGYQSIHTVAIDQLKPGESKNIEIQIRTFDMHERAEMGVAAHWVYKEAGTKGYSGVAANTDYDARIAMLRQLLEWERDLSHPANQKDNAALFDDRIYVLTPMATLIELPQGSTPLDFAYTVHTDLGHRCRGAKVDGAMVPLDTQLKNGQTVEIIAGKDGGPSRDWLNPEACYLASSRAKAKVRAWFNAQIQQETIARGREQVEKLLQRLGKTSYKLDDLASKLNFKSADELFEQVGKDEYSLRNIELLLNPEEQKEQLDNDAIVLSSLKKASKTTSKGDVLVVGIDSLLTQLAKCCKPAPPDAIIGYVTRGKGVSIHRADCTNVRELKRQHGERVIDVQWEKLVSSSSHNVSVYPVDIEVWASDRQGLLRDISEVLAKEQVNVIGVNTQSIKNHKGDSAWMTFTVEVSDTARLQHTTSLLTQVRGVKTARRR